MLVFRVLLLIFGIFLSGCADGLDLPGNMDADRENLSADKQEEGESVLLLGVKSDINLEQNTLKKGDLEPQAGDTNPSPYLARSVTVTVQQIQLIAAQLDADGFPIYDSNGVIQMHPDMPAIDIYSGGATVDLMDPTQFDSLLFTNNIVIPTQSIGDQTDRYNKLEITVSNPKLVIHCSDRVDRAFRADKYNRLTVNSGSIYIVKSISPAPPPGGPIMAKGDLSPQALFTDRRDMDFGFGSDNLIASNKFLINITEPLLFTNSAVAKLVMDPLGNIPGQGVDVHPFSGNRYEAIGCEERKDGPVKWVVMPFGSARFVNDYSTTGVIDGGPYMLEGTIVQTGYDATDPASIPTAQLPYPDPGVGNFWMQLHLNGSGGGLGANKPELSKSNVYATAVNDREDVKSKPNGSLENNHSENTYKPTNTLFPQAVFSNNGNGDMDIIAYSDMNPTNVYYYQNTGVIGNTSWSARQTIDNASAMGRYGGLALGDADNDGDLDAFAGYTGGAVIYYENIGTGFANGVVIADFGNNVKGVETADFNGDGNLDMVFAVSNKRLRLYYGDGAGGFSAGPVFTLVNNPTAITVGYVDEDAVADIVVAGNLGTIEWVQGGSSHTLGTVANALNNSAKITGLAIMDIDLDGDGDIVSGDNKKFITILENSGGTAYNFTAVTTKTGPNVVLGGVEKGDINNDGYPDVVAGFKGGSIQWYDNVGGWSQVTVDAGLGADVTDIEVGDVNGDGETDIVVGLSNQDIIFYANDGAAGFTSGGTNMPDTAVGGRVYMEIGDIDGDGGGSDSIAPGTIADLRTGIVDGVSTELIWTAPGDDGNTGTAYLYDIRYSTSAINGSNFDSATIASNTVIPSAAGITDKFTVFGLSAGVDYYFAIKTVDEAGNISAISNIASNTTTSSAASDTTPPGDVMDLAVTAVTTESVTLAWTAVGDDDLVGTATGYNLRYSLAPINNSNFNAANIVSGVFAPLLSGSSESIAIHGLTSETTYYFAIKVTDDVGNTSGLSNVPQGITLNAPNDTIRNFGRPILIKVNSSTAITDYNNEPMPDIQGMTPIEQIISLATVSDNSLIGTSIRVNGELSIEANPFSETGSFTTDLVDIGAGGIFSLSPTYVRVIEKPQSPDDAPPNDRNVDPGTFQVLSAGNPTVIAAMSKLSTGPRFDTRSKGGLNPQARVNTLPPRPLSISMVINEVNIIQGSINSLGFQDMNNNEVAIRDIDGIHPDINLLSSGSDRFELFNEDQFNNIFASMSIPPDPCFESSSPESCTRYNMVEVIYDPDSLRIVTTLGEVVDNSSSGTPIKFMQQIENSGGQTGYNEVTYRDFGRMYIRITTPQIFKNALNVLKIDPLGSGLIDTMASTINEDGRWQIYPMGIARFEAASQGMMIPGGPYTMEGVVIQQHDINNSTNLPLPNTPTLSDFWVQLTQHDDVGIQCSTLCDPIGSAGAPILMSIEDLGNTSTIISDTLGNITPDVPGMFPTSEFRYLATRYDASVIGTRVKITGEVLLTPDPDGFALGTLVANPTSAVQVLDLPGE